MKVTIMVAGIAAALAAAAPAYADAGAGDGDGEAWSGPVASNYLAALKVHGINSPDPTGTVMNAQVICNELRGGEPRSRVENDWYDADESAQPHGDVLNITRADITEMTTLAIQYFCPSVGHTVLSSEMYR